MPDDHHLPSRQNLDPMAENLEIALARISHLPTRADLIRVVFATILGSALGSAALVIIWLEVFGRTRF
jgi:hypothetical protein